MTRTRVFKHSIQNPDYFQVIDNPTKAYFVGFIAADGCIQQLTKSSRGLSITLEQGDVEILQKLKSELGCSNPIMLWSKPQTANKEVISHFCRLQIVDKSIVEGLEKIGITERKSLTLCNFFENIPKRWRKYAVLGYNDGDGGFIIPKDKYKAKPEKPTYWIKSHSIHVFIRGTRAVIDGICNVMKLENPRTYDRETCVLVVAKKTEVIKFLDIYNGATFFLQRKRDKIQKRLSYWNISLVQTISSS